MNNAMAIQFMRLSIIAFFILVIAMINYINLATARSFSGQTRLVSEKQLELEEGSWSVNFLRVSHSVRLCVALALVSSPMLWTSFSYLSGWNIPLNFIYHRDFWILIAILLFGVRCTFFRRLSCRDLVFIQTCSRAEGKIIQSGRRPIFEKGIGDVSVRGFRFFDHWVRDRFSAIGFYEVQGI